TDPQRGLDLAGTALFVTGLTGLVLGISKGGIDGWGDPVVIGGLIAGAVLLPTFVLVEHRGAAPMLDLTIFRNRMFSAATAAAFINGLSRFALLFVFVFFFQGAQGDDPITAGVKLTPMALGMLVSSPLAGIWADRHGSRGLAALGMVVSAAGLALMTTLQPQSPYWQSTLWLLIVGVGLGMFNSPNTAAIVSIAFVIAVVTSAVPKPVLFKIFSGLASGLSDARLAPFIHNMHTALWALAATSMAGAGVSLLRPRHAAAGQAQEAERPREPALERSAA